MVEIFLAGNPLGLPLMLGSKGHNSIFTEHYHIKLNRFSNSKTWQQIFCLQTFSRPLSTFVVGLKVKFNLLRTWLSCIWKQQHANILAADPLSPPLRPCGQKSTCSEHGRVAYQIKGNHKCSSVVANILPADPHGHVAYQIKGNGA